MIEEWLPQWQVQILNQTNVSAAATLQSSLAPDSMVRQAREDPLLVMAASNSLLNCVAAN